MIKENVRKSALLTVALFLIPLGCWINRLDNSRLLFADDLTANAKARAFDNEEGVLDASPSFSTLHKLPEGVSLENVGNEIRSFFDNERDAFKIETPKSTFQYGEDIFFKVDYSGEVAPEKQKEITEKLWQCDSFLKIALQFDDKEIDYREPISDTGATGRKIWTLLPQNGFPNYYRLRTDNAFESISAHFVNLRKQNEFDKTIPLRFQIKVSVFVNKKPVADFLSQELTVEPENQDLGEDRANELSKQSERLSRFQSELRSFRICLFDATEDKALLLLLILEDHLKNEDEYVRAYFLQRVVRTLHKFMGIGKCPELQKKRAQYEEELGLRWIQY